MTIVAKFTEHNNWSPKAVPEAHQREGVEGLAWPQRDGGSSVCWNG